MITDIVEHLHSMFETFSTDGFAHFAQESGQQPSEPRCHGERHQEVIMRQREALAELREQVKALEQIQGPRKLFV